MMNRHAHRAVLRGLFALILAAFIGFTGVARAAESLNNDSIQKILSGYNEPGYKFLEKLDTGMWKVLYARPGWDFGWEVVVTATNENPEASLLVVGTTLMSTEKVNSVFLMQLLDENSYDTNPGSYSIFLQDNQYFIQYAVKMPQTMVSEQALKEAIGFVAGYSNSRVKALEDLLAGIKPPAAPEQKSQSGEKSSSSGNSAKSSVKFSSRDAGAAPESPVNPGSGDDSAD